MNTVTAIQILSSRMKNASLKEREAFNYLIDYVGQRHKDILINNQLYGKLYIYLYGQLISHYETTVFDPIPQKELHRILNEPLRLLVEKFVDTLNMGENYQDAAGKTATWEYDQVAENLRVMINKSLETCNSEN